MNRNELAEEVLRLLLALVPSGLAMPIELPLALLPPAPEALDSADFDPSIRLIRLPADANIIADIALGKTPERVRNWAPSSLRVANDCLERLYQVAAATPPQARSIRAALQRLPAKAYNLLWNARVWVAAVGPTQKMFTGLNVTAVQSASTEALISPEVLSDIRRHTAVALVEMAQLLMSAADVGGDRVPLAGKQPNRQLRALALFVAGAYKAASGCEPKTRGANYRGPQSENLSPFARLMTDIFKAADIKHDACHYADFAVGELRRQRGLRSVELRPE